MYTRKSLFFILPLIMLVMMSCQIAAPTININTVRGSGNLKTESRPVSGFDSVSLAGAGTLVITQGNEESLTIEAEDNLLPLITTEVVGSELQIKWKDGSALIPTKTLRYNLTLKNLKSLNISGAADVQADTIKTNDLNMDVSGAGKVDFKDLTAKAMTVNSSGAGTFTLAGTVDSEDITFSGTGNYQAGDLQSRTAHLVVSGAGNCTLWVTDELNVQISGLGNVNYYGSPNVTKEISGAGVVKSLGDHK